DLAERCAASKVQEEAVVKSLATLALNPKVSPGERIRALTVLQTQGYKPNAALSLAVAKDREIFMRAQGIWLLGVNGHQEGRELLIQSLGDTSPLIRRRACEALIRLNIEPPDEAIWPLLGDADHYVRTAARLVLQRIDPRKFVDRLWQETDLHVAE